MKKVLVIHGPNLNLLGQREPDVYGNINISEINTKMEALAPGLGLQLKIAQSNH